MTRYVMPLPGWCIVLVLSFAADSSMAGTLIGEVTDAVNGLRRTEAVVWAEPLGEPPTFAPPTQHAEMAQINQAFVPRVLPVLVGTTVDFPNRDTVFHSVFSFSRQQRFEIGLYQPGTSRSATFRVLGPAKVFCNIHDRMFGTILVLPTPYFSTTAADGSFTISDIPAGDYTVQVWHERFRGTPRIVSVTATGTTTLTLVLQSRGG